MKYILSEKSNRKGILVSMALLLFIAFQAVGQGASNIRTFTPSALLKKGQSEVKLFQNLYTQTAFYNTDGDRQDLSQRSTYFTSLNSYVFGVSHNRRWNIGLDLNVKSVLNADPNSSALDVFQFGNDGVKSRTALASVGPTA